MNVALALSLADWRDIVIIVMGIVIAAFFLIGCVFAVVLGLLSRGLLSRANGLLDQEVKPLLGNARETVVNVKGTAEYVSESAVAPITRAYGVVAGVRRAAGVIAGLTGSNTSGADNVNR